MRLLEKYTDASEVFQCTTDPLITYDWLVEVWVVQVDSMTEAHFYGGNRGCRAKQLADMVRSGQFGELP